MATKAKDLKPVKTKTATIKVDKKTTNVEAKKVTKPAKVVAKTTKTAEPIVSNKATKPATKAVETKTEPMGKFVYYKTAKGFYSYKLKANNSETIAVSVGYANLASCKTGIESVRKNINAPIEDQTLRKVTTLLNPKYEIYLDKAGKFRYRLIAKNGALLCTSEGGYSSKDGCKKGIESLAKWAINSTVVNEDK